MGPLVGWWLVEYIYIVSEVASHIKRDPGSLDFGLKNLKIWTLAQETAYFPNVKEPSTFMADLTNT